MPSCFTHAFLASKTLSFSTATSLVLYFFLKYTFRGLTVFDWSIPEDLFVKFSNIPQEKLVRAAEFVHETHGFYKTIEELWDGEI